jgi:pyridoxamine 5'-phosphate oxidase family protein
MSSYLISLVVVISFISHHAVYYVTMVTRLFSQKEMDYLNSQRLARIAIAAAPTLSDEADSVQPDVVPVGYDFDGDCFYVGGMNLLKSTKYKNVLQNNKVAIVIDNLKSVDPWDPRGMKIYGTADIVIRQGGYMDRTGHSNPQYIRISPKKKWSWGIDEPIFVEGRFNVKRAEES